MSWPNKLYALLLILIGFASCVEEEPKIVPDVYLNITINLNLPEYTDILVPGNAVLYPNEGYDNNGIIVYRHTQDEFIAFDATCPQHIEQSTAIEIDKEDFATGKCPHCNTTYSFFNFGQASSGYPLKRYRTTLNGSYLYIGN